jgi:hypothetical protein
MSGNEKWSRRDLLKSWKSPPAASQEVYRRREFFVGDDDECGREAAGGCPSPGASAPDADEPSRREFVKTVSVAAATVAVAQPGMAAAPATRHAVVAAIGDVLIPSDPGDPGYRDLEPYRITEEVLRALPGVSDAEAELWNATAKTAFGKTFLELDESQRAAYMGRVVDGTASDDPKTNERLRRVYRNTRRRVVTLYYANFPEHQWPRDANGMPVLAPGDEHQITNPNTVTLITGWDQSGFHGPLTWQEEERRRNLMKQYHWHEAWSPFDYVPEPPALRGRHQS